MDRIYLDNNATTILDPRVKEAMEPFWCQLYGNPNSLHTFGTEVHPYMRLAFDRLYAGINARDSDDILVTSCATESNNTVLSLGLVRPDPNGAENGDRHHPGGAPRREQHLPISRRAWAQRSPSFPVNADGIVDADILREHIHPDRTALVSIMWANNETGLLFPIRELAALCREKGILFHTDAVQAIGKVPVDVQDVAGRLPQLQRAQVPRAQGRRGPVRAARPARSPRSCTAGSRWAGAAAGR